VTIHNTLAEVRQRRGFSAAELAKQVGVSRQTIYAMEHGNYVPNTSVALKLAQALEVKVEELFQLSLEAAPAQALSIEPLPGDSAPVPGQPVQLCKVEKRLVGAAPAPVNWSFPPADAIFENPRLVRPFDEEDLGEGRLLVAGCDPGISVLHRHLRRSGVELVVAHRNSSQALELLKGSWVHAAGTHLRDEATGESNLPAIRKLFPRSAVAVFSFAVWEEGIVVGPGNPKDIKGVDDLARKDVRLVNREPGAGSRLLLDSQLAASGIETRRVQGYQEIARGHLPAAWEVRTGNADCCIATLAAARVFGLDFIPLVSERYDFVLRQSHLKLPAAEMLLETLQRSAFRRELELLGGYDTSSTGKRIN
jgi:putative molybdopterin biosynthesis protein